MRIEKIALLNLVRRKSKAAFLVVGLMIGVATAIGLVSVMEAMEHNIQSKLEKYGANILVLPKTESLSLSYGGLTLGGVSFDMTELRESQLAAIKKIENARNVAAIGPIVLGPVKIGEQPVLLAGVNFTQSRILKPWWKVNGAWPRSGQILAGAQAAKVLGLETGTRVAIKGRELLVSGILKSTGSQDDGLLLANFSEAQILLDKVGLVSLVEVAALCAECPITDMVKQISEAIPEAKVMAIQQVVKGRMETMGHFRRIFTGVSILVILVAGLVVLVTMMASVRERKRDIGIFRTVGFRRSQVMRIILLEAGVVSLTAGILGCLMGFGLARVALGLVDKTAAEISVFDPGLAGMGLLTALVVGLLAGLYPALTAARMDPNQALRSL